MTDGIVIIDDQTVGVFTFEQDDTVKIQLKKPGMTVKETIQHATDNGMAMELISTPWFPED